MGNAQSQQEANGTGFGGFLGMLGGVLVAAIFPPLAPVALPVGFGAHVYGLATNVQYDNKPHEQKSPGNAGDFIGGVLNVATLGGNLQAGVNYKDGDKCVHTHVCPVGVNPVQVREKKELEQKYSQQKSESTPISNSALSVSPISSADRVILQLKAALRAKPQPDSFQALQQALLTQSFLWVSRDVAEKQRVERVKLSMARVVTSLAKISYQYRRARMGIASAPKSVDKTLDEVYDILPEVRRAIDQLSDAKQKYEEICQITHRFKSSLTDYDIVLDFLNKLVEKPVHNMK